MFSSFFDWTIAVVRTTAFVTVLSCLILAAYLFVPKLFAATIADANQDASRIMQQQEQRLEQLEERARERSTPVPAAPYFEEPPSVETYPDEQCVDINSIDVEGHTLFDDRQLAALTNGYRNKCLSRNEINELLQQITRLYFDQGYVTSRAYLKPQDISQGLLVITVIEGTIELFGATEGQELSGKELYFSFPTGEGQFLNLRDLEQGLEQINRLQSNSVRMSLSPGTNPGDSQIILANDNTQPWHLSVGADNGGQKSTGELQGQLSYGFDSPTGRSDYLNLNLSHDLDSDSTKLSRSIAGLYELPWKWWLLRLSGSAFEYRRSLNTELQAFDTSGTAQNYQFSVDRIVHRSQSGKSIMGISLSYKDERNYLEDVMLQLSSQKLTIVRGILQLQKQAHSAAIGLNLTFHQGVPALGAERDSGLPNDAPRAKFTKLTGKASVIYNESTFKTPLRFSMTANGQFCDAVLYGSEQISIGGLYTVRGYFNEGYSGDRGVYIRNEIILPMIAPSSLRPAIVSILEPFVAFDWGTVKSNGTLDKSYNDLAGWGVGLRARGRHGRLDLLYARPINPPTHFADRDGKLSFAISVYL